MEDNGDIVELSADRRTLAVERFHANPTLDHPRAVTLPTPGGLSRGISAFLLGVCGLGIRRTAS